ncbi:MAG: leucine--tRNA ligase [Methanosarcinaceae archaeon]|nr:leucine--tRNA ligase [Methanosarcinaceae archaeon]
MQEEYDPNIIESKWQKIWKDEKIYEANPLPGAEKYFITIPFPYLNGNLHAGHTRTFTIGDVIARYNRMQGKNVLFPMAFHVTGTPIVGLADLISKKDPQTLNVYESFHKIPKDVLVTLDEPEKIVDFFKKEAEHDMSIIGYSIDWRRKFTTTTPEFKKFIEWQYERLYDLGFIVKGSHPVKWCPVDKNPVEDHDILKGEEATIVEYTLIKFRYKGYIFPCATLRPETTFGVTNLWFNPDVEYVLASVVSGELEENWVVSRECFEKLKFTDREVEFVKTVDPKELIGIKLKNPTTDNTIITLPASFVAGDTGTGVVMSVPAHAPFDYIALKDLEKEDLSDFGISSDDISNIKPVSLIEISDYGEFPAIEVVEEMGVKNQNDPKLDEATKIIYRREFHSGTLKPNTGKYSGIPVSKVKDDIIFDFTAQGLAEKFYEFSEPIICRCGTVCVVNMVKGQWFLNYSNPEWKNKVRKCLSDMEIIPEEMRTDFENKIDWLKDKACARTKGLGTKLPCDPKWLIESLGDSTIYMAYYTIANHVYSGVLTEENMVPELFDYIFLNKGDSKTVSEITKIPSDKIDEIKSEFEYWYPVDMRSSGKDLVPNHLLFYIFHHVALFDEKYMPKAIAVNGFVSLEGEKMSKSKGPLLTLKQAVSEYGADTARMYVLSAAEQMQDADWQKVGIESARKQVERFYYFSKDVLESGCQIPSPNDPRAHIDKWIESRIQYYIKEVSEGLKTIRTRHAIQNAFFLIYNDIRWYHRRGGTLCLKEVVETWAKLMAPFTPHVCEEIWHEFGHEDSIVLSSYPSVNPEKIDIVSETSEKIIIDTMEDIEEIIKVTKATPSEISLYTTPQWKVSVLKIIFDSISQNDESEGKAVNPGPIIKEAMSDPEIRKAGKDVQKYIQKMIKEIHNIPSKFVSDYLKYSISEKEALGHAKEFFEKEFSCNFFIYDYEDIEKEPDADPFKKSKFAEPMRPAIYIK